MFALAKCVLSAAILTLSTAVVASDKDSIYVAEYLLDRIQYSHAPEWIEEVACEKPDEKAVAKCKVLLSENMWKDAIELDVKMDARYGVFPADFLIKRKRMQSLETTFNGKSMNAQHASQALIRSLDAVHSAVVVYENEEFQKAYKEFLNLESYKPK